MLCLIIQFDVNTAIWLAALPEATLPILAYTGKETKLSYLSYKILYNLFIDENLDFSWIKHVKHIFDDTGYSYIWSQQFFQNSDLHLALIRNRLHEQFTQEWHSLIQNSPKAINYRLFKDNFEFENYFNILEDKDIYTQTTNYR